MPSGWRVALVRTIGADTFPSIDNISTIHILQNKTFAKSTKHIAYCKTKNIYRIYTNSSQNQNHLKPILRKIISKHVKEGYFAKLFSQNYFRKTIFAKLFFQKSYNKIKVQNESAKYMYIRYRSRQ